MAILSILRYPDPRLHLKANPVTQFDNNLKELVSNMQETMHHSHGIGLAATQVNILFRVFVMDIAKENEPSQFKAIINPIISNLRGKKECEEGCLSVPGVYEKLTRAEIITLNYQDLEGNHHQLEATGLEAICIQHETDHLEGKIFVDYLSSLKQNMIKRKMKKLST